MTSSLTGWDQHKEKAGSFVLAITPQCVRQCWCPVVDWEEDQHEFEPGGYECGRDIGLVIKIGTRVATGASSRIVNPVVTQEHDDNDID